MNLIATCMSEDLTGMWIFRYLVYLSIWSGVGDLSVSATSQFNPFTHMVISSSDVAEDDENIKREVMNFP